MIDDDDDDTHPRPPPFLFSFPKKQAQHSPGAAPALLRLAADKAAGGTPQVAQAAAIALKNLVKKRWVGVTAATAEASAAASTSTSKAVAAASSSSSGALPEADKAAVRENLFEALAIATPLVKSQIAEVVKIVAEHDFPSRWPGLTESISGCLAPWASHGPDHLGALLSGGPPMVAETLLSRVHAAFLTLRVLCRLYEFRDRGEDGPLTALISDTFPELLFAAKSVFVLGNIAAGGPEHGPEPAALQAACKQAQIEAEVGYSASSRHDKLAPVSDQLGELVKLACKCFWSACYMGVPAAMMAAKAIPLFLADGSAPFPSSRDPDAKLLEGWLELVHDLIADPVPMPFGAAGSRAPDPLRDPEAAAEWPWWKARKWALHIASRLSSRYSDPKSLTIQHHRVGRDGGSAAAALERKFAEEWAKGGGVWERFLGAVLKGPLTAAAAFFNAEAEAAAAGSPAHAETLRRNWTSPRALNLALKYVNLAVPLSAPWRALKPHAASLVRAVALPAAAFDDADEELWQGDPVEFVRRSNDVMVELFSPRAAAVNFAVSLCRQRAAAALAPTMEAVGASLQHLLSQQGPTASVEYSTPPVAATRHVERRADGALLLAGSLADTLKRKQAYASQIEPLLRNVVLPLFASPRGHLRARACGVAGQFADSELSQQLNASSSSAPRKAKTGAGPTFDALFDAVVASLGDPELPVRIDAAIALRSLVEAAATDDSSNGNSASSRTNARVAAALPNLLRTLLQLMSQVDNEDLVSALETLVERAGPGVAPFAAELTRELVAAFNRMSPAVSPAFASNSIPAVNGTALAASSSNGGGIVDTATKDTADDRDDEAAMAAFSVLRALLTIIDAVSAVPGAVPSIEPQLLPLVARLVNGMGYDDAPDVFEEGLDLLSFLTYHSPAISPDLWRLWPETVQAFHSWAGEAYLENMFAPLRNYITRDTAAFVGGRNPLQGNRTFIEDLVAMASLALLGDDEPELPRPPKNPGAEGGDADDDDGSIDSDEYDLIHDFEEVAPAARLLSLALQSCCRLRQEAVAAGAAAGGDTGAAAAAAAVAQSLAPIDAALPAIVNIAVDRLQGVRKRKLDPATGAITERRGPQPPKLLREVLLRVVADALSYDAGATLNAIGASTGAGAEGVSTFFEIWITLATATKSAEGKKKASSSGGGGGGGAVLAPALENFKKAADKKSAVLGLAATLSAPPGSLPPAVEAGAGHVLSAALGLLSAWREQRAESEKRSGGSGGGGGGEGAAARGGVPGWGGGSSDDDDEGGGGRGDDDGDDDDGDDGDSDAYVRRLAAAAAKRAAKVAAGGGGGGDEGENDDGSDDDDDSDYSGWGSDSDDDDEDEADSPLLAVDPRAMLLSSVNTARQLGRLVGIEHDSGMRAALEALAAEVGGGAPLG